MEAEGGGLTDERPVLVSSRGMERVIIPRDYSLGPVFAATRQSGAREVTINDRRYQIGGFHPMRPELHPPALDVRHARALFALLSFRKPDVDSPVISFSFNELCRKYAHSNGGRYSREIRNIVADLIDSYIRITELASGSIHEYRLIERIDIEKRYPIVPASAYCACDMPPESPGGCPGREPAGHPGGQD